jgi:hypothetical protein
MDLHDIIAWVGLLFGSGALITIAKVLVDVGAWRRQTEDHSKRLDAVDRLHEDFAALREQLATDHGDVMKQFGDSLSAVREKIRETEIWNRDNFVRRQDFDRAIDTLSARMDAGIARIEAKIEKLAMK